MFDTESRDAVVYESELKVLSCHALLNEALGKPIDQLDHFAFVLRQLDANKVKETPHIRARLFEYALLSGKTQLANDLIQKLTVDMKENLSPVDPRYLRKFFE